MSWKTIPTRWIGSIRQTRNTAKLHDLVINPIIHVELSLAFDAVEDLDAAILELELRLIPISRPALFLAGKAFVRYRRRGGTKSNVLSVFLLARKLR